MFSLYSSLFHFVPTVYHKPILFTKRNHFLDNNNNSQIAVSMIGYVLSALVQ